MDSIASIRKRLYDAIPDGSTVAWQSLLEKAGEQRKQVESLAFGKPESISRRGNNFVARGKVAAAMPAMHGFKAFAEKEVRFTIGGSGERLVISNISGVKVQPPVGFKFSLREVTVTTDAQGNFTLGTTVFAIPLTIVLNQSGDFITWRFGSN
jgi:hypothetical protein